MTEKLADLSLSSLQIKRFNSLSPENVRSHHGGAIHGSKLRFLKDIINKEVTINKLSA